MRGKRTDEGEEVGGRGTLRGKGLEKSVEGKKIGRKWG